MTEWTTTNVVNFMAQSDVFKNLPEAQREKLARQATVKNFDSDQTVIKRGETGRSLFVVAGGSVSVTLEGPKGIEDISTLGKGDFFGEIAMMTRAHRTATVTANEPTTLLEFESSAILDLIDKYPDFKSRIARTGVARSQEALKKLIED